MSFDVAVFEKDIGKLCILGKKVEKREIILCDFFQSDVLPLYFKIICVKFQMITFKISLLINF